MDQQQQQQLYDLIFQKLLELLHQLLTTKVQTLDENDTSPLRFPLCPLLLVSQALLLGILDRRSQH